MFDWLIDKLIDPFSRDLYSYLASFDYNHAFKQILVFVYLDATCMSKDILKTEDFTEINILEYKSDGVCSVI